ncbi:hypothetical protein SAMN05660733_00094 [Lentzea albidocapillata]|uniref:Uncharacterized protein n=1 Tax=Lentzea albidocapillata TaxID=40571 RepID=A0A1W1ZLN4_9PSEU|nr:hypothetical protein SAMN05660733_00094 [Lentzea albidocapillata]
MSIDENLTDDKQARETLSSSVILADAIAVELAICPGMYLRSAQLCALWKNLRSGLFYGPGWVVAHGVPCLRGTGRSSTGTPLNTAVPESGSTSCSSVSALMLLMLTPGSPAAVRNRVPGRSWPQP